MSAVIGVTAFKLLAPHLWLAAALAVATSIAVMHATKTAHLPGEATALIAVMGGKNINERGYWYVMMPVGGNSAYGRATREQPFSKAPIS
ncbi:MAG: HPP family protein [Desulfobaccales bacterium]